MDQLTKFKTIMELKRYSSNTIATYSGLFKAFFQSNHLSGHRLEHASEKEMIPLMIVYIRNRSYGYTSQNSLFQP